jgi:amino acid transporter
MINHRDPTTASIIVLMIAFVLSCAILTLSKPMWVQKSNKHGVYVVSAPLVVTFSFVFAIVSAIGTLLFVSAMRRDPAPMTPYGGSPLAARARLDGNVYGMPYGSTSNPIGIAPGALGY